MEIDLTDHTAGMSEVAALAYWRNQTSDARLADPIIGVYANMIFP